MYRLWIQRLSPGSNQKHQAVLVASVWVDPQRSQPLPLQAYVPDRSWPERLGVIESPRQHVPSMHVRLIEITAGSARKVKHGPRSVEVGNAQIVWINE